MGKIIVLDEITSNQIAAGEVVERPASVVKELVENSMDAGATAITVEIKNGGIAMMRIIDNGSGIDHDDVEIAFERHATSKIRGPLDLDKIGTFGFRGEALASIASVSKIELLTRTLEKDSGISIKISGGRVSDISPAPSQKGTSITVSELFFNTPARFKFLKKDTTEGGHVADIVTRIALGNPDIAFKFINNKSVAFQTPGNGDLLSAIFSIYGKDTAKLVDKIEYNSNGIKVHGYAGKSEIARASRTNQSFYINRRYVRSKIITAAIDEAYKTVLMKNKYPFIVISLDINLQMVDVNVHPQKMEVRFSDEQEVFRAVYNSVNNALIGRAGIRGTYEERPKSNIFEMNPEIKKNLYTQGTISLMNVESSEISMKSKVTSESRKFDFDKTDREQYFKSCETKDYSNVERVNISEIKDDKIEVEKTKKTIEKTEIIKENEETKVYEMTNFDKKVQVLEILENLENSENSKNAKNEEMMISVNAEIEVENVKTEVTQNVNPQVAWMKTESWNYIGQVFSTYIIISHEKEMYLIDQHAAHERVMYELLKKRYEKKESLAQMILIPETINLTSKEAIFLSEKIEDFEKIGFELEEFGQNAFILRAVPFANGETALPKELFLDIFDYYYTNFNTSRISSLVEETLFKLACKSAVKANTRLTEIEVKSLISDLAKMDNPHTCPHGRPTVLKLSKYEIEKLFKRII